MATGQHRTGQDSTPTISMSPGHSGQHTGPRRCPGPGGAEDRRSQLQLPPNIGVSFRSHFLPWRLGVPICRREGRQWPGDTLTASQGCSDGHCPLGTGQTPGSLCRSFVPPNHRREAGLVTFVTACSAP
jgi:hypothetical protein